MLHIGIVWQYTVRARIIGPCAKTLGSPLLVMSRALFFFVCPEEQVFFWRLSPLYRGGNSGRPGTWSGMVQYLNAYSCVSPPKKASTPYLLGREDIEHLCHPYYQLFVNN